VIGPLQPHPPQGRGPYVIAHRGISGKAPENTLASFAKALDTTGIDMIELDVHLSKGNDVIVLHDRSLQRTTTGNGLARQYTLQELKRLDAGSWFSPRYRDERIPTLNEVFELVQKRCWVNVELKHDAGTKYPIGMLEQRVLDVITDAGYKDHVLCSSFSASVRSRLRQLDATVKIGVIYNIYRDFGRLPSTLAAPSDACVFVCAKYELSERIVRDARTHGIAVYVYTLNSVHDVKRMVDLGIAGLMSDNADNIVPDIVGYPLPT
jgi:glycerophosphoryl diester phosphodiesterase